MRYQSGVAKLVTCVAAAPHRGVRGSRHTRLDKLKYTGKVGRSISEGVEECRLERLLTARQPPKQEHRRLNKPPPPPPPPPAAFLGGGGGGRRSRGARAEPPKPPPRVLGS